MFLNKAGSTLAQGQSPLAREQGLIFTTSLKLAGAARTRTPSTTNYDVHSPTWGDGRPAHQPSAMWATDLGHGPS